MDYNRIAFSDEKDIVRPIILVLRSCLKHDLSKLNKVLAAEQARYFRALLKEREPALAVKRIKKLEKTKKTEKSVDEQAVNTILAELFGIGREHIRTFNDHSLPRAERDRSLENIKHRAEARFYELEKILPLKRAAKIKQELKDRFFMQF